MKLTHAAILVCVNVIVLLVGYIILDSAVDSARLDIQALVKSVQELRQTNQNIIQAITPLLQPKAP